MPFTRLLLPAAALALAALLPTSAATPARLGYVREIPPELPQDREARHARVAARRAGPGIIVHRGASAFAPENTLEAYAAAMDAGADGCEMDLRRTADGVLVLFHDDMLDHLSSGFGIVPQVTYYELLSYKPAQTYGRATRETRPPTFAAVLALARQRAMLLHLDVKETGLDGQIGAMLDEADAWDHVVAVNSTTAPELAKHPKVHPLRYKGPGIYDQRQDVDPDAVRAQLARPGELIMVDDPRVAARELGRKPEGEVPPPPRLREEWEPRAPAPRGVGSAFDPAQYLRTREGVTDRDSDHALRDLLASGLQEERTEVEGPEEYQRRRTEHILDRAWAAERLGERMRKPRASLPRARYEARKLEDRLHDVEDRLRKRKRVTTAELLEYQVRHRSLHRDWMYHGLDGAMAVRALGRMGETDSVPVLVDAFLRADPELKKVESHEYGPYPIAWTDFRLKMYVLPALGQLPCPESKRFLKQYLAMTESQARELGPVLWEDAAKAYFRQDLTRDEIEAALKSLQPAIRGTAILECVDHPVADRREALRALVPWALDLRAAR